MTIARTIAERVVRPVWTGDHQRAVGLYIGEESKFVIPLQFVFGLQGDAALDHLLEELRQVVERAILQATTLEAVAGAHKEIGGDVPQLDARGTQDAKGKITFSTINK